MMLLLLNGATCFEKLLVFLKVRSNSLKRLPSVGSSASKFFEKKSLNKVKSVNTENGKSFFSVGYFATVTSSALKCFEGSSNKVSFPSCHRRHPNCP